MINSKSFSIGIMAHNEEKNIGILLEELLRQAKDTHFPFDIIVVASGCTDRTVDIARKYAEKEKCIKLMIEKERKGKAEAINLFLKNVNSEYLFVSSADILPQDNTLMRFLDAFSDFSVGMVGARPFPIYSKGFTGILNRLLWDLHHQISLKRAKLGEFIAFRNIIDEIPYLTAADEASIEALMVKKGFKIKYLSDVIIYNYAPKDIISFIKKRIRIYVGHLFVKDKLGYCVSTYSVFPLFGIVLKKIKDEKKYIFYILVLVFLEVLARLTAFFQYYIRKKTYHIWQRN